MREEVFLTGTSNSLPLQALVQGPVVALALEPGGHHSSGCSPARCDMCLKPDLKKTSIRTGSVQAAGPTAVRVNKKLRASIPKGTEFWGGPPCPQPSWWCNPSPAGPTAG